MTSHGLRHSLPLYQEIKHIKVFLLPANICDSCNPVLWFFCLKLLFLGREYPKGADYFRDRLRAAFAKNKDVRDPEKIKELISRGEFVVKELEALYYLRKYRALKKRYYETEWIKSHAALVPVIYINNRTIAF